MNQTPFRIVGLFGLTAFGFSGLFGCEKSGDFLLPEAIEGVPGIVHIEAENGGPHEVPFVADRADQQANTIYTEIGPTGDVYQSGITMEFLGTGGTVCAFVDPEMVVIHNLDVLSNWSWFRGTWETTLKNGAGALWFVVPCLYGLGIFQAWRRSPARAVKGAKQAKQA